MNSKNRYRQLGNSFTSCLLTVVVVFGGLGFYYFKYFQWRHFENPKAGLTITTDTDAPQRNDFRKRAISAVADPLLQQIKKFDGIRKKSKFGKETYPEMEQELTEVRNRLKEILTDARLRACPKKFQKKYEQMLMAFKDIYDATKKFEESFALETAEARKKVYDKSYQLSKSARSKTEDTREYFAGDGWHL